MPGAGGGTNSGAFGGGVYADSSGNSFSVPELNFDTFVDVFANIQNTFSQLWISLNQPAYSMIQDIVNGDGEGVLSGLVDFVFDSIALTGLPTFLNQFTLLEFIFGSGLTILISLSLIKFFKL